MAEKDVKIAKAEEEIERENKMIKNKMLAKRVWNVVFWTLFAGLFAIWITDYIMVRSEKEPLFCLSKETHKFDDGTVNECTGLGYKVYTYNRTSIKATEFGPFFISMRDE